MVAARTESITVTLSKDTTDKTEEIRNIMNQMHQKGKEAAISMMKSRKDINKHEITLSEDEVMREFSITGNKLIPLKGDERSLPIEIVDDSKDNSKKRSVPPALEEEYFESDNEDSYSYDNDDDDFDEDDQVIGLCLHCGISPPPAAAPKCAVATNGPTARGIQVSCDNCHSFICTGCHWCHEYQANHEIRVCDRCDAFYCKACDEMDQCEDCGEVVCGGCGALSSCKFCGCGLCEDCATACGRCGIVLCSRDAKFAVECDTCKMPYCLVCLASGTKDPCVRCGHRPSKRVEQLVHLRLKSIYKAFKQSGAALSGKGGKNSTNCGGEGRKSDSSDAGEQHRNRHGENNTDASNCNMPTWMAKKAGVTSSASMPLPASVQRYAELHGKDSMKRAGHGDVGDVLQVAAATAASAAMASDGDSRSRRGGKDFFSECSKMSGADSMNKNRNNSRASNDSGQFAARTQAEADAAAAALLAELDEEKLQHEASTKAKKSKKKKKKERQAAKEKEKEGIHLKAGESETNNAIEDPQRKKAPSDEEKLKANESTDKLEHKKTLKNKASSKKKKDSKGKQSSSRIDKSDSKKQTQIDELNDSEDDDITLFADKKNSVSKIKNETEIDELERNLADLVSAEDLEGIEKLLTKMKGVPGRAALRKNAKKAVKRIKEERAMNAAKEDLDQSRLNADTFQHVETSNTGLDSRGHVPYRAPEPLLKVVSKNNRVTTPGQTPRYECVLHMAPSVVGWVIGKGGQRIRDLMEDSGAKVWIDQDSMGPNDMRVVYVSGNKKSIDLAVTMVKDLVAKAPVGGTTHSNIVPTSVHSMNDTSSVTSTRSSLTSTPVSLVQSFTQQVPPMAEKPSFPPVKKPQNVQERAKLQEAPSESFPTKLAQPLSTIPTSNVSTAQMSPSPGLLSDITPLDMPSSSLLNVNEHAIRPSGRAVHEMTCEPRFVALLIGRRGWTVKQIQDTSGARVDIDQTVNPRRIIISGNAAQVHHAVNLVRGVLSYPHAKQHYTDSGDEDDDGDVNEEFLASISSNSQTMSNAHFAAMQLADDKHISPSGYSNNVDSSVLQNSLNHFPINQQDIMQHQQFNSGTGMEMFHRSSGRDAVAHTMQHHPFDSGTGVETLGSRSSGQDTITQNSMPPISTFINDSLGQPALRSEPRLYMERHHSTSAQAENPNFISHAATNDALNPQIPRNSFQYESILPLGGNMGSHGNNEMPLVESHPHEIIDSMGGNHMIGRQRPLSYTFNDQAISKRQDGVTASALAEQDAVNSMFGNKVDDSLINSFNDFSFLDFMSNAGNEKPTEEHSVGLGGVRLDSSDDKESLPSLNQYDKPIWGPGL